MQPLDQARDDGIFYTSQTHTRARLVKRLLSCLVIKTTVTSGPVIPDHLSPLLSIVNEFQSEIFFLKYPHLKNKKSAPQIN